MKKLAVSCLIWAEVLASCLFLLSAPLSSAYASTFSQKTAKAGAYMSDAALTAEVKAKFLAEKDLDSLDIKVVTTKGIVTLRGQVVKQSQASLAERVARETAGVRDVVNKISVMP